MCFYYADLMFRKSTIYSLFIIEMILNLVHMNIDILLMTQKLTIYSPCMEL